MTGSSARGLGQDEDDQATEADGEAADDAGGRPVAVLGDGEGDQDGTIAR